MNFGGYGGDVQDPPYIFLFIIQKTEKVQEHDPKIKLQGPPYIFCLLFKKRKKYKSVTYT